MVVYGPLMVVSCGGVGPLMVVSCGGVWSSDGG